MNPAREQRPRRYTVYVVDDDPSLVRAQCIAMRAHLESYTIEGFTDPYDAFTATVAFRPNVLVTDQQMPGCTGTQLALALRQALGDDCPEIVLVSGDIRLPKREAALFTRCFTKPVRLAQLVEAVRQLAEPHRSGIRPKTPLF